MSTSSQSAAEPIPLTPVVFHILLALASGAKHGYGVIVDVRQRTDGSVRLGTGTLYTAMKRLLQQGMIEECDGPEPSGTQERRKYYRLLPRGLDAARQEARRLEAMVLMARERELLPLQEG